MLPDGRQSLKKIKDSTAFKPHQVSGVRKLARLNSFIEGDDMGLGKSLISLAVAAIDFELGLAKRVLVIAPATVKGNWADEIEKHTHFSWSLLDGTPKQRKKQLDEFDADMLIVNYEQVATHLQELNALSFDIIIYDEAHYLQNPKSARTVACHALRARRHFLLTGSPLLNHVNNLWALLHRVDPQRFPNYWTFVHRYCVFGGFKNKSIVGVKHQSELQGILQGYMIRRTKKELGLSGKQLPIDIYVDAHPEQLRLIKQAKDEGKLTIPGRPDVEIANSMTRFLLYKRILSTTANVDGMGDFSFKLDSAAERAKEIIDNGRPVVIFTQFRPTLAAMATRLTAMGVDSRLLHGDVPMKDRQSIVRAWTEDAGRNRPQVLLCMFQVAGVGLNLVAASDCFFVDELFVPKLNDQAVDRLDRIGQTMPVQLYRFRVRKSMEQRVAKILDLKSDIFTNVVEEDDWKAKLIQMLEDDDWEDAA